MSDIDTWNAATTPWGVFTLDTRTGKWDELDSFATEDQAFGFANDQSIRLNTEVVVMKIAAIFYSLKALSTNTIELRASDADEG